MSAQQVKDYEDLRAQLEEQLREAAPPALVQKLMPLARPAITLHGTPCRDTDIPIGFPKIGGLPDLPAGTSWPAGPNGPLRFGAQIHLSLTKTFDLQNELPERGLMAFFYDLHPPFPCQVLLLPNDNLIRATRLADIGQENGILGRIGAFFQSFSERETTPRAVELDIDCQLPTPGAPELERLLTAAEKQRYAEEIWDEVDWDWGGHQLLGYPYSRTDYEPESQAPESAFNGLRPVSKTLYGSQERLLFQLGELSSDSNSFWGAHGVLGFLLSDDALKSRRYDRCRLFHGLE